MSKSKYAPLIEQFLDKAARFATTFELKEGEEIPQDVRARAATESAALIHQICLEVGRDLMKDGLADDLGNDKLAADIEDDRDQIEAEKFRGGAGGYDDAALGEDDDDGFGDEEADDLADLPPDAPIGGKSDKPADDSKWDELAKAIEQIASGEGIDAPMDGDAEGEGEGDDVLAPPSDDDGFDDLGDDPAAGLDDGFDDMDDEPKDGNPFAGKKAPAFGKKGE